MKEERMAILKMISEGKINADEGVKLLKALNPPKSEFSDRFAQGREKFKKTAQNMDKTAKQVTDKLKSAAKDAEPKMRETMHCVAENMSDFAENVGSAFKSFFDSMSSVDDEAGKDDNIIDEIEVPYEENDNDDEDKESF